MRKAWILCAMAVALGAFPHSARAFFDRQRLESGPVGPVVQFYLIEPSFGAPAPDCRASWCVPPAYSYPAYAPGRLLWAEPVRPFVGAPRAHPPPRYFPSRRRHP